MTEDKIHDIEYELTDEQFKSGMKNSGMLICDTPMNILKRIPENTVDLIYTDPPFCSKKEYNAPMMIENKKQEVKMFEDMCKDGIPGYINWINPILERCRDVLKPTGVMCLHLDWHVVHNIKLEMDKIFGIDKFMNEIVWHYQPGTKSKRRFGQKHDTILIYSKGTEWTYNQPRQPSLAPENYIKTDSNGRKFLINGQGNTYYLDEGRACDDVWSWGIEKEFNSLGSISKERLGYPTQKPESLLERIIKTFSISMNVVVDPFCGSGTTPYVANRFGRVGIGIDINPRAISVSRRRMQGILPVYGITEEKFNEFIENKIDYTVHLKHYKDEITWKEFQDWACMSVGGRGNAEGVRDGGIDGYRMHPPTAIQVKQSYGVGTPDYDRLRGSMAKKGYKIGLLIGFSFSPDLKQQIDIDRLTDADVDISTITVEQIFKSKTLKDLQKEYKNGSGTVPLSKIFTMKKF